MVIASASVNALPVSLVSTVLGTSTVRPSNGFTFSHLLRTAQPHTVRDADSQTSRTVLADRSSVLRLSSHCCASQLGVYQFSTPPSAVNTACHRLTVEGAGR